MEVNVLFLRRDRLHSIISFFVYRTKFAECSPMPVRNKSTCQKEGAAPLCLDTLTRDFLFVCIQVGLFVLIRSYS